MNTPPLIHHKQLKAPVIMRYDIMLVVRFYF